MPEIAKSHRARVTGGRSKGIVIIVGALNNRDGRVKQQRRNSSSGHAVHNAAEKRRYSPEGSRPSGPQCFHCQTFGHLWRECPKLTQKNQYPYGQGSMYRSLKSSQQQKARK